MDSETPKGLQLLYDLFVKASEFPGESSHNSKNLYHWGEKIKSLHDVLSPYHDEQYNREYALAQRRINEISLYHPSRRYLVEGYDVLHEWLGSISRLYDRLGLMIPQNMIYTEGGEDGV